MSRINYLIDAAQQACGLNSDNKLAGRLKVSRSAVSVWRKGGKITDEYLAALIELSKSDPSEAIRVRAEQASSGAEIRLWNQMLTRISAAAMLGAMYIM